MLVIVEDKTKDKKEFLRIECKNQQEGRSKVEELKLKNPTHIFKIMSWFDT